MNGKPFEERTPEMTDQFTQAACPQFVRLDEPAQLFVILVSYNTASLLQRCIDHLRSASSGLRVSVVIVDNASPDGSVALIERDFPDCTLIENTVNVGFGRANNQALPLCNAPYVLLLNPDAYVSTDTLRRCVRHMDELPRCGVLGPRVVNEAGHGNASIRDFPNTLRNFAVNTGLRRYDANDLTRSQGAEFVDCDWVTGCFYMVRKATIDDVGLFDPRYFLYFEEVDHCRAVLGAGWKVQCLLSCTVIHEGGASARTSGEMTLHGQMLLSPHIEGELLYMRKHEGTWGMSLAVILGLTTDLVVIAKTLLRSRDKKRLRGHVRHAHELCRLALATRGGRIPTR